MSTQAQRDRNKRKRAKLKANRIAKGMSANGKTAKVYYNAFVYFKTHTRPNPEGQPTVKNGKPYLFVTHVKIREANPQAFEQEKPGVLALYSDVIADHEPLDQLVVLFVRAG